MELEAKIDESIKRSIKKGGGKHKTKNKKSENFIIIIYIQVCLLILSLRSVSFLINDI